MKVQLREGANEVRLMVRDIAGREGESAESQRDSTAPVIQAAEVVKSMMLLLTLVTGAIAALSSTWWWFRRQCLLVRRFGLKWPHWTRKAHLR